VRVQTIVSAAATAMSRVPPFSVGAVLDQFRAALLARDIIPPDPIVADGRLHRCHAAGRNGRGDAAYVLHLDGLPAGGFENHRDGRDWETWCFDLGRTATAAEREVFARVTHAALIRRDDDAQQHLNEVRSKAEHIWALAPPAPDTHPYLARKAVAAYGLRL
jgi:putative DNA primase/helicase